ncbi:hypothetical protein QMK17_22950 [Rhodococcus sp. G-MC3]|uniref:hypothetical protein n=1 Tax=Rhodococcus sp. G-MC3 TaxID=3046209 RepID=UPI0024BB8F75|nr:hypothetical protein [Rhodococcus sp. G-MC3]MDJ0396181.1 hypothetical protein [Rhodococcus sp. G-MC3]
MDHHTRSPSSARDRARKANAQRLADARARLKKQEDDLVAYFDATRDEDKIEDDLAEKIAKLHRAAQTKLQDARSRRVAALASLKDWGETYNAIASLVDLPVAEATKLIRSIRSAQSPTAGNDLAASESEADTGARGSVTSPDPGRPADSRAGDARRSDRDVA